MRQMQKEGPTRRFRVAAGICGRHPRSILIRIGKLPVNLQAQVYDSVVKPDDAATADWSLRLQVQFVFPK